MKSRPDWDEYFLIIALDVARRGTCIRRCYGAVIVDTHNRIVSTGYCGSPKGDSNCCDLGVCRRKELNVPSGQRYELCNSVHAEQNAITFASVERMQDATVYIAGFDWKTGKEVDSHPCDICLRIIKNSGIRKIIYKKWTKEGDWKFPEIKTKYIL